MIQDKLQVFDGIHSVYPFLDVINKAALSSQVNINISFVYKKPWKPLSILLLLAATIAIKAAPTPSSPIEIHYSGVHQPDQYQFDECLPFKNDGATIEYAELASVATCTMFTTDECERAPCLPRLLSPLQNY